jgi:hypothetical protein
MSTSRPFDAELGRMVRDVRFTWASQQEDPELSWVDAWEDLTESQRTLDIAIGRALFEFGALTAVKMRHEVDGAMP